MNRTNRIDFLDTLRAFIILLVIVMHTALAYIAPPFRDWIHAPQTNGLLSLFCVFAESGVLMPILFFISGYLALPSLSRHGTTEFLKGKLVRLGIPYAIGIFILSPILWLMAYYAGGGSLPLLQAFGRFFTFGTMGQFHFWYLGVLLLFFYLLTRVVKRFPGLLNVSSVTSRMPSALFFGTIIAFTTIVSFAVNQISNYSDWACLIIIQFQSVKFPLYYTYFMLGIYAYRNGWFKQGYHPRPFPWAGIYLAALLFTLGLYIKTGGIFTTELGKALINFSTSVEALSALMTCLALFEKLHSSERPLLQKLSGLSFNAYIVHLNLVFIILVLTRDAAIPVLLKYALQAALAVSLSWGISFLGSLTTALKGAIAKVRRTRSKALI
jgi:glucan biosynthesis protein C